MTTENTYSTLGAGLQAQIVSQLMDLFRSNNRGYGLGEFQGAQYKEEKNKWIPGGVRWVWGETTPERWKEHLSGVRLLGQGVICDDNRVWYACLDVDTYEIDYLEEMSKIKRSGLPLVVFRTKSGGLRVTVFFSEAIEADVVIPRMRKVASFLGYAKCEIFPKQPRLLVEQDDCPSWIYMPFGGTGARNMDTDLDGSGSIFAEQGCMNDTGGLRGLVDAVSFAMSQRITKNQFLQLFAGEEAAKANGKANGKKHRGGAWIEEETEKLTIDTMFHDGPPCLWYISQEGSSDYQNNFLLDVSTFLKKKYPENWDKALEWVNYHVLKPVGDRDRLLSIIKRGKNQDYEYMCQQEPICSRCFSHACRRMPYGVGTKGNGSDFYEMGMTILDRVPQIFMVSIDGVRISCNASDLLNLNKFKEMCLSHGASFPPNMKRDEWERIVVLNVENAVKIPPSTANRTNAAEIELLTEWLSIRIPTHMRVGDKPDDAVRVNREDNRVYFKWKKLARFCRMTNRDDVSIRKFVESDVFRYHKEESGSGVRDWYRWTHSVPLSLFDEEEVQSWMAKAEGRDVE